MPLHCVMPTIVLYARTILSLARGMSARRLLFSGLGDTTIGHACCRLHGSRFAREHQNRKEENLLDTRPCPRRHAQQRSPRIPSPDISAIRRQRTGRAQLSRRNQALRLRRQHRAGSRIHVYRGGRHQHGLDSLRLRVWKPCIRRILARSRVGRLSYSSVTARISNHDLLLYSQASRHSHASDSLAAAA